MEQRIKNSCLFRRTSANMIWVAADGRPGMSNLGTRASKQEVPKIIPVWE